MANNARTSFILLLVLSLTGCSTTVRYMPYTAKHFPPKQRFHYVNIFVGDQKPPVAQYYLIGKVELSGRSSNGVTPQALTDQAIIMARKKGADAIINVKSEAFEQKGVHVVPESVEYQEARIGWHRRVLIEHYQPEQHLPYSDTLLTFKGELVVYK